MENATSVISHVPIVNPQTTINVNPVRIQLFLLICSPVIAFPLVWMGLTSITPTQTSAINAAISATHVSTPSKTAPPVLTRPTLYSTTPQQKQAPV